MQSLRKCEFNLHQLLTRIYRVLIIYEASSSGSQWKKPFKKNLLPLGRNMARHSNLFYRSLYVSIQSPPVIWVVRPVSWFTIRGGRSQEFNLKRHPYMYVLQPEQMIRHSLLPIAGIALASVNYKFFPWQFKSTQISADAFSTLVAAEQASMYR